MNLEEVWKNYSSHIEQSQEDCHVLEGYIKEITPPNYYVEIGTRWGGSALVAKYFAPEGVDVYTIDVNDLDVSKQELKDRGIKFIHSPSVIIAEIWGKPIQVLFIDGNHNEALMDFNAWEKHVVKGGIILFHDYAKHSPNVIIDCDEIAKRKDYEVLYNPLTGDLGTGIFQIKKL
jgi:predicted O-methyltransferase YrrM